MNVTYRLDRWASSRSTTCSAATTSAPGNSALLDIVAALDWVQAEISGVRR